MTAIPNADHLPDDPFGYSCYTLVLPAQESIRQWADRIEQEVGKNYFILGVDNNTKSVYYVSMFATFIRDFEFVAHITCLIWMISWSQLRKFVSHGQITQQVFVRPSVRDLRL